MDWQRIVVSSWLGVDAYGRWAARSCGEHVPRQNGKTLGTTVPRMNWGAFALNELVLYTSHLQKTSTETFEDVAAFFDQKIFRKYLKAIRTALGREAVEFKSGGKIKFLARTRNGGRGQHADLLVFDEDQELTDEQQASFMPCLSASSNPQILYTGTPPDENAPGMVARRIRERALGNAPNVAYAEWSVPEIGDVSDRDRWYETNPSLGILILESSIETEAIDMARDKFARERLGWWSPASSIVEHVVTTEDWGRCMTEEPPKEGVLSCAVKFSPDGKEGAIAVCRNPGGGVPPHIEIAKAKTLSHGIGWARDWVLERKGKLALTVVDGMSAASALTTELEREKIPRKAYTTAKSSDVIAACAMFADAVRAGELTHYGQPDLDAAVTMCGKRKIGNGGGFGFESNDEGDATLAEAAALAYWAAKTTKRNPNRKLRVG